MKDILCKIPALMLLSVIVGCVSTTGQKAEEQKQKELVGTYVQLSAGYMQPGRLDLAKDYIEKALEIDADDSQANNVMAIVQWKLKDYDAADKYFRKAVRKDPDNAAAQNNYGVFLCERGKIDKAVYRFEKAIDNALYKTPAEANLNAGLCLMKKPALEQAEGYFKSALKFDPKLPGALYNMAVINFEAGRAFPARAFIERYFAATRKDTPESLMLAIKIERALGAKDAEASYALKLRSRYPDSPQAKNLR